MYYCLRINYAELGVLHWHLNPVDYENDEELKKIREARGYNYMVCDCSFLKFTDYFYDIFHSVIVIVNTGMFPSFKLLLKLFICSLSIF